MTTSTSARRVGKRMQQLHDLVTAMPGMSKSMTLRAAGLPVHGPGSGRELNRAIDAGLVLVEKPQVNLCALFASEHDRRWWLLRRELYAPGTDPMRVLDIIAELDELEPIDPDAPVSGEWDSPGTSEEY